MKRTIEFVAVLGVLLAGCADLGAPEGEEAEEFDDQAGVSDGAQLFNKETFGGNGTTCATCHPSDNGQSGTLSPADVEKAFQADPNGVLFQHDRADTMGGSTFNRFRAQATILVNKSLPPNVSLAGSTARSVTLVRAIPTTMNTPALDPVLMLDGRDPNLLVQAQGAITAHAQGRTATNAELNAIADFQQTKFNRNNLAKLVSRGTPLTLPYGTTESEIRGRRFFIADDQTDPDMVGELPNQPCGWCHSGDMLNGTSKLFGDVLAPIRLPEGFRFLNVLVSELNRANNPVHTFEFRLPDGSVQTVQSPDPGLALVTGNPQTKGFFKIPTLWGSSSTAPYFHDNSSRTFAELMDHYQTFFTLSGVPVNLTAQNKADIIAYLNLL